MKLATLDNGTRDGALILVRRDNAAYVDATDIAPTLQAALDNWDTVAPQLQSRFDSLQSGDLSGTPIDLSALRAPLPRAYEWIDGSAYINHVVLVRRARNAEPPATLETDPLVYQGGSGIFLSPTEDIVLRDAAQGLDFEAELVAVLGDTPLGTQSADAGQHIKLFMLVNDITLRSLIPAELAKNFGFFTSKPASTFAPFAITPDEFGDAYDNGRIHLPMRVTYNGDLVGQADAGPEMHFSFFDLVQHITQTRAFTAGSLLGSGTISNENPEKGISCLAERRMREIIATGSASTPFMNVGDTVHIEVLDHDGASLFGAIDQKVVAP